MDQNGWYLDVSSICMHLVSVKPTGTQSFPLTKWFPSATSTASQAKYGQTMSDHVRHNVILPPLRLCGLKVDTKTSRFLCASLCRNLPEKKSLEVERRSHRPKRRQINTMDRAWHDGK